MFHRERFHFGSRMLTSLPSFRQSCGVSDHHSYERLNFSAISFSEFVFFPISIDGLNCFCSFWIRLFAELK